MEDIRLSFKKVSEEAYKDIAPYIDALIPYISFLSDLYLVDLEGHHLLINSCDNKFIIVDNDQGTLNTYSLEFDEKGRIIKYADDLGEYELSVGMDENIRGVRCVDKLSGIIDQLVYFPAAQNNPRINIDYYQCFVDSTMNIILNYDMPAWDTSLQASLLYTDYHYPNKIIFSQLLYFLNIIGHEKEVIYYDDLQEEQYCRALFKLRDMLFAKPFIRYSKDKVLKSLEELGYKTKIPNKMRELLSGQNDELKRLQLIADEYKIYENTKKIQ